MTFTLDSSAPSASAATRRSASRVRASNEGCHENEIGFRVRAPLRAAPGECTDARQSAALRSPDHGLRIARQTSRYALRELPCERGLQGHAARMLLLPHE